MTCEAAVRQPNRALSRHLGTASKIEVVALRRKKGVGALYRKCERERERKRIVYRDRARAALAVCLPVKSFRPLLAARTCCQNALYADAP